MSTDDPTSMDFVSKLNSLYGSSDLDALESLLDPHVRWGASDDPNQSCQNRQQVIAWWRRAKEAGVRAKVTEVMVKGENILVGLDISGRNGDGSVEPRWQVLTIKEERIIEITGFDSRDCALARLQTPPQMG